MALNQVRSSKGDFSIYRNLLLIPAIGFGICGQLALSSAAGILALVLYAIAVIFVIIGAQQATSLSLPVRISTARPITCLTVILACASLIAGALVFAFSGGNRFRIEGVLFWIISVIAWWAAWKGKVHLDLAPALAQVLHPRKLLTAGVLILILGLGAYFRFANLTTNPLDMNSDQAEKLLDIHDLLDGKPYIFFEHNTVREPFQFYWTVGLIKLLGIQPDFMALKIGTSLIGLLMLPAIFLLAREVFDTRLALIATLFAAVASWGVITARFGLRYPLAPCAVAWTMYFLIRSLKRNERNSMLATGICMGIGLLGYSAFRFMIVVVPVLIFLWMVWTFRQHRSDITRATFLNALLAAMICFLVLIPLLRYATEHPDNLLYRAVTRLSNTERPISGNALAIFADNIKNVLLMFNVTHDEVWVATLPDRPAMDIVLGALLVLGTSSVLVLSFRQRSPLAAFVLIGGVLMLMPSALSIAFPRENPSVVRAGGALPMLMIICAVVPANLLNTQWHTSGARLMSLARQLLVWLVVNVLCFYVIVVNYQRVFFDYPDQYCKRAQNASDIAREMQQWITSGNPSQNAWIIGFPHWVDSRAVGVWIGDIYFANTAGVSIGQKDAADIDLHGLRGWFALNEGDSQSLQSLMKRYPQGLVSIVSGSQCVEKQFIVFTVQ